MTTQSVLSHEQIVKEEAGDEGKGVESRVDGERRQDEGHRIVNEVPQKQGSAVTPDTTQAADKEAEAVAGPVGEHLIDLAVPGAGLVAKITGIAADVAPKGQVHGVRRQKVQEQEREDEKEPSDEDEIEDDDLPV